MYAGTNQVASNAFFHFFPALSVSSVDRRYNKVQLPRNNPSFAGLKLKTRCRHLLKELEESIQNHQARLLLQFSNFWKIQIF